MKREVAREMAVRLAVLVTGFCIITILVYCAGKFLVPLVDSTDKAILMAINPKAYLPFFDEFFRAVSDYTNYVIIAPLVSWMIAYGLYRAFPSRKPILVGVLTIEAVILTGLAIDGRIWPNKTYVGANIQFVVMTILAFGAMARLFYRMDDAAMRRFGRVFWLILISGCLTDFIATDGIKVAVARPRPLAPANKPWNDHVRVIPDEVLRGNNSFPSGHTSGTFSLLAPIFWYVSDRRVRAGLIGWGVLQGLSRVYTAAHFPFCCLMGGILGFSVGTLVFFTLGSGLRGASRGNVSTA